VIEKKEEKRDRPFPGKKALFRSFGGTVKKKKAWREPPEAWALKEPQEGGGRGVA